jgi:methionyl-tRNA formyltransferase
MTTSGGVVVCAYSEVGHACLSELIEMRADVRLVVTHEDAPGETTWFASVAERAGEAGIPVLKPDDVNAAETARAIAAVEPDLLYSFYFRQMIRPHVLEIPRLGPLNLHGSLLPNYRGRAPVNWVLVHGERETGVTLHYMDAKPDHGEIVGQAAVRIERDDTALSLTRKLADAGREVLREMHPRLLAGTAPRIPQDHRASSYFGGRGPADGRIDWAEPAETVRNLIRAVTEPWPGAFTTFRDEKLLVWWAETESGRGEPGLVSLGDDGAPRVGSGDGLVRLVRVGAADAAAVDAVAWARDIGLKDGERLGAPDRREGNAG